jgi:hypothetical protein
MGERPVKSFWFRLRCVVRWCRITLWLSLLALVVAAIYLNAVGLPDFLRTRLLDGLRQRGVDLNCARLYWSWYRGVVADGVTFGPLDDAAGPQASAAQVAIHTDLKALCHGRIEPRTFSIRNGHFRLRLSATNEPPLFFALAGIQCSLHFLPNDEWQLDQLQAHYGDATLRVSGSLTNASAFREWMTAGPAQPPGVEAPAGATLAKQLRGFTEEYQKIHFTGPPDVSLVFGGDAREWHQWNGLLTVRALGADTRWGSVTNAQLVARLRPARQPHTLPFGKLTLEAQGAKTPWATTEQLRLELSSPPGDILETGVQGRLTLATGRTTTPWGRATAVQCAGTFTYGVTNPIPLEAAGEITFTRPRTPWGQAGTVRLTGQFRQVTPAITPDETWAAWAKIAPFAFSWQVEADTIAAQQLAAEHLTCGVVWAAPRLLVTNLQARLYGGTATAEADLDAASRAVRVKWNSDFDLLALKPVLPAQAVEYVDRISWTKAPALNLEATARLPAWTNLGPAFAEAVLPTLAVTASFQSGPAAYQGLAVQSAHGQGVYAAAELRQLDLHATRPEGAVDVTQTIDQAANEVCWTVRSTIDPMIARPFAGAGAQPVFAMASFTTPPTVDATVRLAREGGALRSLAGTFAVSNVTVRGESAVSLTTGFSYTNNVLDLLRPEGLFTNSFGRAEVIQINLNTMQLHITNGSSTMDPLVLGRAIDDDTTLDIMREYQFLTPPTAKVHGTVGLDGKAPFDLHLELAGGPFRWWRINSPQLRAKVGYVGHVVTIEDVHADFYDGALDFDARFDVAPTNQVTGRAATNGAFMQFHAIATNANLHALIQDLTGGTRQLSGVFSADLRVTNAFTLDWDSWQGFGNLSLKDGELWQMPVFSIFSTILNTVAPGLGNVHFKSAAASYGITNGVISSRDLRFNSPLVRINYRGSVDFHENMDGIVQASVLRNAGVFGSVFSAVLWLFTKALEYKVTGTLDKPNAEPLHMGTKLLLLPLAPLEAVTGIFTGLPGRTNAPATNTPAQK